MYLKAVKHAVCFLSGSQKSAVAALLMKNKGFYISGVFLQNIFLDEEKTDRSREQVNRICECLEIPLREVSLNRKEWESLLSPLASVLSKGGNPSADVLFNKHIIFGSLHDLATSTMGADFVVTGHYARTTIGENFDKWTKIQGSRLLKSLDLQLDQSYVLCQVSQRSLQASHFPLGDFTPQVIPKILQASQLKTVFNEESNQQEKSSHFHEDSYMSHLKEELDQTPGKVVDFLSKEILDTH